MAGATAALVEIERRFLVATEPGLDPEDGVVMVQGYLAREDGVSVRIRRTADAAWVTVKGPSEGARRAEVEWAVSADEAAVLLGLCIGRVVDKTRWRVPVGAHVWDVDVFHGANEGLVIAEVELGDEDEAFVRPPWLGPEITGDRRYANASLADRPWSAWR